MYSMLPVKTFHCAIHVEDNFVAYSVVADMARATVFKARQVLCAPIMSSETTATTLTVFRYSSVASRPPPSERYGNEAAPEVATSQ